jgi:hypothetical protein
VGGGGRVEQRHGLALLADSPLAANQHAAWAVKKFPGLRVEGVRISHLVFSLMDEVPMPWCNLCAKRSPRCQWWGIGGARRVPRGLGNVQKL